MEAINSDGFETINMTGVPVPNNLSEFPASVQQAIKEAVNVEADIDASVPIPDDPNTCPNITTGGTKRARGPSPSNARNASSTSKE